MNPTQEQTITKAQSNPNEVPAPLRRGRVLAAHIDAVIRGLFVRGQRVVGLRINEGDLGDLSQFAATQPGQKLSGHGYLTDDIGYVRVQGLGPDQHPDSPHVGFDVAGAEQSPAVIVPGVSGDHRTRFFQALDAHTAPDYTDLDAAARSDTKPKTFAGIMGTLPPGQIGMSAFTGASSAGSIILQPAPSTEGSTDGAQSEGASADGAQAEGGGAGSSADGASGAGTVAALTVVPGVSGGDGSAAPAVPGGDKPAAVVPVKGGEGKVAKKAAARVKSGGDGKTAATSQPGDGAAGQGDQAGG